MAFIKSDQGKNRNLLLAVFFQILVILLCCHVFTYAAHEESTCWNHIISIVAGDCFTAGLRDDGCVVFVGDEPFEDVHSFTEWTDIEKIELCTTGIRDYIIGYCRNGRIKLCSCYTNQSYNDFDSDGNYIGHLVDDERHWEEEDFSDWDSIEKLILTDKMCVALRSDGTVLALGMDEEQNEIISGWTQIKQILSPNIGLALREDGTVMRLYPDAWTSTIPESSGVERIIICENPIGGSIRAIRMDGTVSPMVSPDEEDYFYIQPAFTEWRSIVDLKEANDGLYYGLTENGRICICANRYYLESDDTPEIAAEIMSLGTWTDIAQLNTEGRAVGIKNDGSVVSMICNSDFDIGNWTNVKRMYRGREYTIGLCDDGTVLATGNYGVDPAIEEIRQWTDISEIIVSGDWDWWSQKIHFVGLKNDGTVVATGDNTYGQCNVTSSALG